MPEDIMKRARASLSTQEIELSTLIANLHKRMEETNRLEASLERERAALVAREKQIVQESERREAAKLRELETRFEEMQRRWQQRGDETLARISETAEKRKAVDEAHRQTARVKREMREDWEKIIPQSGEAGSAQAEYRGRNAGSAEGHSRACARAPNAGRGPLRSGSRLHENAGFDRRCGGSAA